MPNYLDDEKILKKILKIVTKLGWSSDCVGITSEILQKYDDNGKIEFILDELDKARGRHNDSDKREARVTNLEELKRYKDEFRQWCYSQISSGHSSSSSSSSSSNDVQNNLQSTDKLFFQRFEEIAHKCSDNIALQWSDPLIQDSRIQTWSYSELNDYANRIAHGLLALKKSNSWVDRECIVAILFENCSEAVATILGAMKAGFAYVPMAVPSVGEDSARLGSMLVSSFERSCARLLIIQDKHIDHGIINYIKINKRDIYSKIFFIHIFKVDPRSNRIIQGV